MLARIPDEYRVVFNDVDEEMLASALVSYVIYDAQLPTSPATWQDAEIYIRFRKRDVLNLDRQHIENAGFAFASYQMKYIIEHTTKMELVEMLNELFSAENMRTLDYSLYGLLRQKFKADINELFLVQEKRIVRVKDLQDFDALFRYPAWLEFDPSAKKKVYEMILADKLTDEQIDYFLGVSEQHEDYAELYPVVKHILMTTKTFHTFWTAGDVLNLIWIASPQDKKTQKWFNDEIFEIFWPRVGSTWPVAHEETLHGDGDDELKIMRDAIGWLKSLPDLKKRLPELLGIEIEEPDTLTNEDKLRILGERLDEADEGIKLMVHNNVMAGIGDETEFVGVDFDALFAMYAEICEGIQEPKELTELQKLRERLTTLVMKGMKDYEQPVSTAYHFYEVAEQTMQDFQRERKAIGEMVAKASAK